MFVCTPFCTAGHDSSEPPDHQAARLPKDVAPRFFFQVSPQLVGTLDERHVEGMLEVCFTDDAGLSVRRAEGVRRRKAVEAEHSFAASGDRKSTRLNSSHLGISYAV